MTLKAKHLFIPLLFCSLYINAQVTSTFNADDDGWIAYDANGAISNTPVYNAVGGNPGGYISFTTASASVNFFWKAPVKFLGNMSRAYNQNLTFDLQQSVAGADNLQNDLVLAGSSGV